LVAARTPAGRHHRGGRGHTPSARLIRRPALAATMPRSPETFYLRTFGCQMNDHDSERIAGLLAGMGLRQVAEPDDGDVLVYNTCSIREKADTRLMGHLGVARRLKGRDKDRRVVVAGCLAQSRQDSFFADFPFVDVLVGPQSLFELPHLLDETLAGARHVGAYHETTSTWSADLPRVRREGPLAWVQIMTGCTNYCSYCIVPYVRGPEASRPPDDILAEVRALVAGGVREITLLGQNVNAYGCEPGFDAPLDFPGLLAQLDAVPGLERVRFMTSHPKDVSPGLIAALADLSTVCESLHLPVQSGSDRILSAMGRGYSRADYLALVTRLRTATPGLSLTTDLIVAFPGETEADFALTLSLVQECDFDGAFTFVYSPRRGTRAAGLSDRVAEEIAEERMGRLVAVVQTMAMRKNQSLVESTVEVLVEGRSRQSAADAMGRTRTYKTVNFAGAAHPGELVRVCLQIATSTSFRGVRVA
jgi:tRNA-2-methylthio-N6-dimethylallyladenosine synthase